MEEEVSGAHLAVSQSGWEALSTNSSDGARIAVDSSFFFARRFEIDVSRLIGISGNELAVDDCQFNHINGCRSTGSRISSAEIKPPRSITTDDDVAVRPEQRLVLQLPVGAII